MANIRLNDIMWAFDGSGNVVEWIDKFELLVKLKEITKEETVLPN